MRVLNLTPHAITVLSDSGEPFFTHQPEPVPARVEETPSPKSFQSGWPAWLREAPTYGAVTGLPEPEEGTWMIVSLPVLEALRRQGSTRRDVLGISWAPGDVNRYADGPHKGQVRGVHAFVRL